MTTLITSGKYTSYGCSYHLLFGEKVEVIAAEGEILDKVVVHVSENGYISLHTESKPAE